MNPEEEAEEDGANIDLDSQRKGKCVVLKTSTRQVNTIIIGSLQSFFLNLLPSPEVCCGGGEGRGMEDEKARVYSFHLCPSPVFPFIPCYLLPS